MTNFGNFANRLIVPISLFAYITDTSAVLSSQRALNGLRLHHAVFIQVKPFDLKAKILFKLFGGLTYSVMFRL